MYKCLLFDCIQGIQACWHFIAYFATKKKYSKVWMLKNEACRANSIIWALGSAFDKFDDNVCVRNGREKKKGFELEQSKMSRMTGYSGQGLMKIRKIMERIREVKEMSGRSRN